MENGRKLERAAQWAAEIYGPSDTPAVVMAADTRIFYCTDAARRLLGTAEGSLEELLPSMMWPQVRRRLEECAPVSLRVQAPQGDTLTLSAVPIPDGEACCGALCLLCSRQRPFEDPAFSAAVHDLKSPLAILRSTLFLLRRKCALGDEAAGYLDMIERNADRAMAVVSNLSAESGGGDHGFQLNTRQIDLSGSLETLFADVSAACAARDIRVESRVEPGLTVQADWPLLERAVMNLVSNAVKFCRGSIRLTAFGGEDEVFLEVADDGEGMDEATRRSLFVPYAHGEDRSDARTGSGLGLFIAKSVVEQHRGRIEVESSPGGGTRFVIALRRCPALLTLAAPATMLRRRDGLDAAVRDALWRRGEYLQQRRSRHTHAPD
ncbi:sensor histidine kinase [Feifania hominis]|uniref:histidine kinase n=1 Tax=Feifania hominis TaxID=2763660 RepID=A0A926DCZ8_9FIRM|nr:HAMP domain-containing sensor histidine kinase [Feifania hominis]MBC8536695.1 HAMP domain-containing histidine kinase [Feifania hominis]